MEQRRSITRYFVILTAAGIAVNLAFSRLALHFEIPLYLDSIGTILTAIVGGYLPGIIVGFSTNVLNGLSDPITLYYGIISILLASAAARLASRGWFQKLGRALASVLLFALIGGGLGSVLTWLLYGFSFGSGITAPLAVYLHNVWGLTEFLAQLSADFAIDVVDKLIAVLICFLAVKLLPASLAERFPDGFLRPKSGDAADAPAQRRRLFGKNSLRSKTVALIAISALILGVLATTISSVLYSNTMTEHYITTATSVANMEVNALDPDDIRRYLTTLETDEAYFETEAALNNLRDSVPEIEYIYVYQVRETDCVVVFDADTPDLPGEELGTLIPFESAFLPYMDDLLAGREIPPIISNDMYGWLLTVYKPILDSSGACVAYAAADISMNNVMTDRAVFIIKMVALLFGASIVIVVFALSFAEHSLVDPINAMAKAAEEFAYSGEDEHVETTARLRALEIHTGDEIENLYNALAKTGADISDYILDAKRKTAVIAQMRSNIIISFANMVENRDQNTGEHILRTAAYVKAIAEELMREGHYADILDQGFIDEAVRCAPLHDLGKIRIPDAILNKPGKLTPEEFMRIKTHTTAGREIIEGILLNISDKSYLAQAVFIAAHHHERWDGTGYPEGLSGTDIPLSARIMAVADVYDALVSKRSYKEPLSKEAAFEIIRDGAGTHFDPLVVAAFVSARGRIVAQS